MHIQPYPKNYQILGFKNGLKYKIISNIEGTFKMVLFCCVTLSELNKSILQSAVFQGKLMNNFNHLHADSLLKQK